MISWPSKSTLQRLLDLAGLHYTTSERSGPFWQSMLHNFLSRPLSFLDWTTAVTDILPRGTITESVCARAVCVCVWERERVCVCVCACEREFVFCVWVCVWESVFCALRAEHELHEALLSRVSVTWQSSSHTRGVCVWERECVREVSPAVVVEDVGGERSCSADGVRRGSVRQRDGGETKHAFTDPTPAADRHGLLLTHPNHKSIFIISDAFPSDSDRFHWIRWEWRCERACAAGFSPHINTASRLRTLAILQIKTSSLFHICSLFSLH